MDLDRKQQHSGYWSSRWPVECGGNRRQKVVDGRLDAAEGTPEVTTRTNGRWNVMVVERDPGEMFVAGTMAAFVGEAPYGWVEKIDPESLEPISSSPQLPCGDHVWCGAVLAHSSGSLFNVNGSYLHRLDPDCSVTGETRLPADEAHNGLLALSDGSLITKDLRLAGHGPSTLTRIDPESLDVMDEPLVLPEGSMGRIAADVTDDGEFVYVPGIERLWRIRVAQSGMSVDESWQPHYRDEPSQQGLAWDTCLSGGYAWLMDNGDIPGIRAIFGQQPNGRFEGLAPKALSWQHPAPWAGPQRLLRVDVKNAEIAYATPFGNPGGGIIAPPVHVPEHGVTICWDSINGGLAGVSDTDMSVMWTTDVRATMQPIVFPESGEVVINDFTGHGDDLVAVDVTTGDIVSRADTGSRLANGMFLSPGPNRSVYYCSTLALARVRWV
ncbi:MAG: hypothetical protein ACI8Y4_000553 [Candidatus Poriferisodalaceae bacterium]|jgi:hypothetical protein